MDLKRKGIEFPTPSDEDLLLVQSRQPATVSFHHHHRSLTHWDTFSIIIIKFMIMIITIAVITIITIIMIMITRLAAPPVQPALPAAAAQAPGGPGSKAWGDLDAGHEQFNDDDDYVDNDDIIVRSPTGSSKGVGGREVQQARVPPSGQLTEGQVR